MVFVCVQIGVTLTFKFGRGAGAVRRVQRVPGDAVPVMPCMQRGNIAVQQR